MSERFERRRLRVYVAGPISSDPFEGVHRGFAAGKRMFLDGMAPFVPHADAFWFLPEGYWQSYLEYDLEYIAVSDAVYRLRGNSRGADKEVAVALELGIPVFYEADMMGYLGLLDLAELKGLTGKKVSQWQEA